MQATTQPPIYPPLATMEMHRLRTLHTTMTELNRITARFDRAYKRQKKAKDWLEKSQRVLFKAFTEAKAEQTLAQQTVGDYSPALYPGWRVKYTNNAGTVIEEDPSLMGYTHTNHELGMVIGRTEVHATPELDDERLKREDPALWERVSEWPPHLMKLMRVGCDRWTRGSSVIWTDAVLDGMASSILEEAGVERVLKDPARMHTMDLGELQEYILPGKVSVRLVPPRAAKEDETDDSMA